MASAVADAIFLPVHMASWRQTCIYLLHKDEQCGIIVVQIISYLIAVIMEVIMIKTLYESSPAVVIIIAVLIVLLLIAVVVVSVLIAKRNKLVRQAQNKNVLGDASVARNEQMTRDGEYYVMVRNVIYNVGQSEDIIPGKYLMKCGESTGTSMNMRHNGLVQCYDSGVEMYLTAGDTISPVSGSVIIKLL